MREKEKIGLHIKSEVFCWTIYFSSFPFKFEMIPGYRRITLHIVVFIGRACLSITYRFWLGRVGVCSSIVKDRDQ